MCVCIVKIEITTSLGAIPRDLEIRIRGSRLPFNTAVNLINDNFRIIR